MFIKVENEPTVVIRLSLKEVDHLVEAINNVNRSKVHEHVEDFLDKLKEELDI